MLRSKQKALLAAQAAMEEVLWALAAMEAQKEAKDGAARRAGRGRHQTTE